MGERRGRVRLAMAGLLLAAAVPAFAGSPPPVLRPPAAPDSAATAAAATGRALFERNVGQDAPDVRYRARIAGALVRFTGRGLRISVPGAGARQRLRRDVEHHPSGTVAVRHHVPAVAGATFAVQFVDADPAVRLEAADPAPTRVNYLRGADPARWHVDVPTSHAVRYSAVWPGVDLRYDATRGPLKGTYTVAPGADPRRIRVRYAGARVSLGAGGELVLATGVPGVPEVVERPPVAWQDTPSGRRPVAAAWTVRDDGTAGFTLGAYDPSRPLVIDPEVEWSRVFNDILYPANGMAVAVDRAGTVLAGGVLNDPDAGATGVQRSYGGGKTDVWVAKIAADGSRMLWLTYLGGAGTEWLGALDVDAAGRVAFVADTDSADFPTRKPAQGRQPCPCSTPNMELLDAVAGVLTPDGNAFVFSTYLSSRAVELGLDVKFGPGGTVSVLAVSAPYPGETRTMTSTRGAFTTAVRAAFVARLTAAGRLSWISAFGPTQRTTPVQGQQGHTNDYWVESLAVDRAGEVTVAASSSSPYSVVTAGVVQPEQRGWSDFHVTKLSADGRKLRWATYLGGSKTDTAKDMAADATGAVYVIGDTVSVDFPAASGVARCPDRLDGPDMAVAKIDNRGRSVRYAHCLGSRLIDKSGGIAVDGAGRAFLFGFSEAPDFPTTRPFQVWARTDDIVLGLAPDGTVSWASPLGGHDDEDSWPWGTVTADGHGGAFFTAWTASPDFPGVALPGNAVMPPYGAAYVTHITDG